MYPSLLNNYMTFPCQALQRLSSRCRPHRLQSQICYTARHYCCRPHRRPFQICNTARHYCCRSYCLPSQIYNTARHYCCRPPRLLFQICYTARHYCCRPHRLPPQFCYTARHYCCRLHCVPSQICYTAAHYYIYLLLQIHLLFREKTKTVIKPVLFRVRFAFSCRFFVLHPGAKLLRASVEDC